MYAYIYFLILLIDERAIARLTDSLQDVMNDYLFRNSDLFEYEAPIDRSKRSVKLLRHHSGHRESGSSNRVIEFMSTMMTGALKDIGSLKSALKDLESRINGQIDSDSLLKTLKHKIFNNTQNLQEMKGIMMQYMDDVSILTKIIDDASRRLAAGK